MKFSMELISHLCCTHKVISLSLLIVISYQLASVAAFSSNFYGSSYSLLRRPRLELHYTSRDVGAMLYFYNTDTIVDGITADAVNCTVTGGHLEDSLERASSVYLKRSSQKTWDSSKSLSFHQTLQTRTTFSISYDVEGNLTCRDTLGEGLVSKLLLRFSDRETLVVRFGASSPSQNRTEVYNNMTGIHRLYANITYSEQVGRLVDLRIHPEPKVTLRVSYYSPTGMFDQRKIHQAVTEVSKHIAKERKLSLISVRSTRYCLDSEEGNFTWPMTPAGLTATPDNPCVDNNGTPLPERRCLGNFFDGVYWDEVPKRPHVCLDTSARSTRLLNLTRSLMKSNVVENLWEEIRDGKKLSSVEVYFASQALKKTAEKTANPSYQGSTPNIETVVNVVNAIIDAGKPTIKAADDSYGSSVVILESALKLMVAAASPNPTPVNTHHLSAFSSKAGVGINGFIYIPKTAKGQAKGMVPMMRHIGTFTYRRMHPNLLVYLYNQTEDYSIVSTRYEDDSLFSSADISGMRQEGPVLGIRLFQKPGHALEEMRPIPLFISFYHESPKNYSLQCVMWESSVVSDGWSLSGCTLFSRSSDSMTNCICMIVTSMDIHFTLVKVDSHDDTKKPHLTLSPLKYNNGALLTFYNAQSFSGNLENQLSCQTSWGNNTAASQVTLQRIGNFSYNKYQLMVFFNISFMMEGYLQCRGVANKGLISNEVLLIKPNSATILISSPSKANYEAEILKYLETKSLYSKFTTLTISNSSKSATIRVIQMSDNDHFDFLNTLENMSIVLAQKNGWFPMEIRSNRYCLKNDEGNFNWPTIKPGHSATPTNPCVNTLGAPTPSRKCIGDYFSGIYWDKVPQRPDPCEKPSERAQRLQNFSRNSLERDIFKELLNSVKDNATLSAVESNQFIKVLKNVADEISQPNSDIPKQNLSSVGNIVNAIIDSKIKDNSRAEDNQMKAPPVEILSAIDTLLEKSSTPTAVPVITTHFSAVSVSPGKRFRGFTSSAVHIVPVEENKTLEDIANISLTMGAFLEYAPEDVGMIYTSFNSSTLFSENVVNEVSKVDSPIIGLKIFAGEQKVIPPNLTVIIIFAHDADKRQKNRKCHSWDKDNSQWSPEGCIPLLSCNLPPSISRNADACLCTRLTHFAMLVTNSSDSISEEYILHIASIVGCSISIISILGIFVVGIIFPDWTRGASRKVQLNLSASLAMLMGSYLAVSIQGDCPYSEGLCISLGVMIHYSLLTAFTWMLVVAFLQCMRLTRSMALGARTHAGTHIVLRASAFAWGIPIFPVAGTLIAGTSTYARRQLSSLCYPTGGAFYAGVLFPVASIVSVNTLIFFWIMCSLFCNNFQTMRVHQRDRWTRAVRRFSSAVFLFCLLGICWLSGVFIELTKNSEVAKRVLLYLFCVTVPLQGTSLFVFFVACDRRMGEKITRAITIFSDNAGSKQSTVQYIAKFESSTSEKATDSTNFSTIDRGKNRKINLSQGAEQQ